MEQSPFLEETEDLSPDLVGEQQTLSTIIAQARKAMDNDNFVSAKSLLHTALNFDKNNAFVIQRLALATYKAQLPSPLDGLKEALMILNVLKPETSTDPETVGLAGAIYKRLWEKQENRSDLDQSIFFYEKGFHIDNDYYNGINVAYLLNVRASISSQKEATNDHITAQGVRRKVIWNCMQLLNKDFNSRSDQYWICATLEEVYFGLGYYKEYQQNKEHSIRASNGNWERETTESQIHKLSELIAFRGSQRSTHNPESLKSETSTDPEALGLSWAILAAELVIANKELVYQSEEKGKQAAELITERQQSLFEQRMARLERLNLVGQMAAGIGHEIRNPMTTVRGYLQLLGSKPVNVAQKPTFDLMISELDRANVIITEFLSLAQTKPTELKFQDLNDILSNIYPLIEADTFTQNKQLSFLPGEIPNLEINGNEITQLVLNLTRNGLEAMPERGCLTIKSYVDDGKVVLAIEDEGCGIPPENLLKIGTPFFTTKDSGTGLGLASCYKIAKSHNAKIHVDSSSKGTTFYIFFPIPVDCSKIENT